MKKTWTTPSGKVSTLYKDMLAQPHLMIAGATGSGKSTVLDALIYTALYKAPADIEGGAQFIIIDPKSRLFKFEHLPHTVKYAIFPQDCLSALELAVNIMMDRFNNTRQRGLEDYDRGHLYVIIDEFYPLVTSQQIKKKDVISAIQQLGALGRAANVHVILCTQRPTTDIIPGSITANFDSRVGLHTAKSQHSRNIIEQNGCEALPRYGQGYYINPEGCTMYYIPMIEKEELTTRIKWWTDQKTPSSLLSRLFSRSR